ncbi:hypothetical protein GCM10023328_27130 [Modestobacter marinus]|uniref:Uncharacterized protein n=1 Tax=Modestobacter marinus TaxID=477641 RepID=A0ABQ2G8S7_9ACTN|nr:hypothetical protein GCM10011589_41950 [Modestobacter marinus]
MLRCTETRADDDEQDREGSGDGRAVGAGDVEQGSDRGTRRQTLAHCAPRLGPQLRCGRRTEPDVAEEQRDEDQAHRAEQGFPAHPEGNDRRDHELRDGDQSHPRFGQQSESGLHRRGGGGA